MGSVLHAEDSAEKDLALRELTARERKTIRTQMIIHPVGSDSAESNEAKKRARKRLRVIRRGGGVLPYEEGGRRRSCW